LLTFFLKINLLTSKHASLLQECFFTNFSFKLGCNNRLAPLFDSSVGSNNKKKGCELGSGSEELDLELPILILQTKYPHNSDINPFSFLL
jgi:hypothetical protein